VSFMTKTQVTSRKARARRAVGAASAGRRGRRAAASAARRGRRAAAQAAPLASSAAEIGRRGLYRARVWTAPRLDRTGQALEYQVAPKVAAMLSATARRIEPVRPKRRRWPLVAAGVIAAAGLSATAAYLMSRRGSTAISMNEPAEPAFGPIGTPPAAGHDQAHEADVNGRVRTS
jgi:hypothetical protein